MLINYNTSILSIFCTTCLHYFTFKINAFKMITKLCAVLEKVICQSTSVSLYKTSLYMMKEDYLPCECIWWYSQIQSAESKATELKIPYLFICVFLFSCRYPFYMLSSIGQDVKLISWLRYTAWIPLYPLGILFEGMDFGAGTVCQSIVLTKIKHRLQFTGSHIPVVISF